MRPLTAAELQTRLTLDWALLRRLDADPSAPVRITGHRTAADAAAGRNPVGPGEPPAPVVRATYSVETLRGPGMRFRGETVIVFDLLANGNYPSTTPVARVVSPQIPWTPHFTSGAPVCLGGRSWLSTGRRTAADLVIHVGRLLNFDEPPPQPGYSGYNGAAIAWWAQHGHRPLDPGLVWPVLDPNAQPDGGGSGIRSSGRTSGIRTAGICPGTPNTIRSVRR